MKYILQHMFGRRCQTAVLAPEQTPDANNVTSQIGHICIGYIFHIILIIIAEKTEESSARTSGGWLLLSAVSYQTLGHYSIAALQ